MHTFIFPYEMVPRGASIIIYGFGVAGRDFFAQMQYTKYCRVLFILDLNAPSLQNNVIDIKHPSDVDLHEEKFDYVVVSVVKESIAESIRNTLMEMGVPKSKIIIPLREEIMGIQCDTEIYKKFINHPAFICDCIKDYFLLGDGNKYYFSGIVQELKTESKDRIKTWLDEVRNLKLSNKEMVIVLSFLVDAEKIDKDELKELMSRIISLDASRNAIFDAGIFLTYLTLFQPGCIYDGFFKDWRVYLQRLSEVYGLRLNAVKTRCKDKIKRIVICKISPYVHFKTGGYHFVVRDVANSLNRLGYEVALAPSDIQVPYEEESFWFQFMYSDTTNHFDGVGKNGIDPDVKLLTRHEHSVKGRMQGLIDDVCKFNPDLIIDMMDDFSPHMYVLQAAFPILYIPVRGIPSGSFFHRYITADLDKALADDKKHGMDNAGKLVEHKSASVPPYDDTCCYTREQFGFNDDNFIIVTVGSRLKQEVNDELGQYMKSLLERYPNVVWLLVGDEPGLDLPIYGDLRNNRQIIYWGEEAELTSLYKLCDVFLNPDRQGGGMSIRIAMQYGVVIAMLNRGSDALPAVGSENAIDGDYEKLVLYIERLIQEPELLKEKSNLMRHRISAMYDKEEEIRHFVAICEETVSSFYESRENDDNTF